MKTILFFSALILTTISSFGQGIQYQAIARNADGQILANKQLVVGFGIVAYDANIPWYEEEHEVETDQFGQFSVAIGLGEVVSGDWHSIDWSIGPPDLSLMVDAGNGFVDLGRTPLQSVPHSLFAQQAETVDMSLGALNNVSDQGPAQGQVLRWNGSSWAPSNENAGTTYTAGNGIQISANTIVNTGDTNPDDDITTDTPAGGDISGKFPVLRVDGLRGRPVSNNQPVLGEVLKWDGTKWAPSDDIQGDSYWSKNVSKLYYDNGWVGIGTNNPLSTFHVNGGNILVTSQYPSLTLNGSSSHKYINFKQDNVEQASIIYSESQGLYSYVGDIDDSKMWILDNDGNFGVGTFNPIARMHVKGGALLVEDTTPYIALSGSGHKLIAFGEENTFQAAIGYSSVTGLHFSVGSAPNSKLCVFTDEGNFGIGTDNPGNRLTVSRNSQEARYQLELRNEGNISQGNYDGIKFTQGAGGETRLASIQLKYQSNGYPDMAFHMRNRNDVLYLKADGKVGLGTNNPGTRLDVNGTIRTNSEVQTTKTGSANMIPIAYGSVGADGITRTGSGNFAVVKSGTGRYEISIVGEDIFFEDYIVNITVAKNGFANYSSISGKLRISTKNFTSIIVDQDSPFSFVVYKP